MTEPRWLNPTEIEAWRCLAAALILVPPLLDEATQDYELTFFEYSVLVVLSSADDQTLAMSELAMMSNGSLSRTSHLARRLENRGLVRRHRDPDDRRVTLVTLTDSGQRRLAAAAPAHVEGVRRAVMDPLSPQEFVELGRLVRAIVSRIDPTGPWGPSEDSEPDPPSN